MFPFPSTLDRIVALLFSLRSRYEREHITYVVKDLGRQNVVGEVLRSWDLREQKTLLKNPP